MTYEEYANITIDDVFSESQIENAPKRITNFLETVWFENVNGRFVMHHLPNQANFSSVNAIVVEDFDKDGIKDILLGGNTTFNRVRVGQCEASYGVFLKGKGKRDFEYIPNWKTQINFKGTVRSFTMINTVEGKKLIVGINNTNPLILEIQKK